MAAGRALTPLGVILKWILIPATFAAIGFFLIGAKIGNVLPGFGGSAQPSAVAGKSAPSYVAPDVDVKSDQKHEAPDVQVTSERRSKRDRKSVV